MNHHILSTHLSISLLRDCSLAAGVLSLLIGWLPVSAQVVNSTTPSPNARNAPLNTTVSVNTSAMLPPNANLTVFSSQAGGKKAGANQVVGTTAVFIPNTAFKPGERLMVTGKDLSTNGLRYIFEFNTATAMASAVFSGTAEVGVSIDPYGLVTADVDGDNDLDLLTVSFISNSGVSVRLNDGYGNFSGTTQVSVGPSPIDVAAADVDGDGDLDILTANSGASTVSLRLNDGHGNFSGTVEISVGPGPVSVIAADVDGDGDLDILTANSGLLANRPNTVSVRLNDGNGNFSGTTEVSVGQGPMQVVAADIDGDGDLDILTAHGILSNDPKGVSIRLNDGTGNFIGTTELSVGARTAFIVAADIDGDGDLDILATDGGVVKVRFNDGTGNFSGNTEFALRGRLNVADLDGDGDLDLLSATTGPNVSVRFNNGSGNFFGDMEVSADPLYDGSIYGSRKSVRNVVAVDVDGDGDLDILAAAEKSQAGSVSVRLNYSGSPLPVKLMSFTAQAQGDLVQLAWKTQFETDFAGFQIERSLDAREFSPLSWVKAKATDQSGASYGYNDLDVLPTASILYYRLKMQDQDGSSNYSSILSVSLKNQNLGLLVLGNPAQKQGNLKLLVSSPQVQSIDLRLFNSAGKLVSQQAQLISEGRNQLEVSLGQLEAGIYELVLSANTSLYTQRIVIE